MFLHYYHYYCFPSQNYPDSEIEDDDNENLKPTETFSLKKITNKISKNDEHLKKGKEEGTYIVLNISYAFSNSIKTF